MAVRAPEMVKIEVTMPSGGKVKREIRADLLEPVTTALEADGYVVLPAERRRREKREAPLDLPTHDEIEEMLLDVVNLQAKLGHFRSGLEKAWLRTKPKEETT